MVVKLHKKKESIQEMAQRRLTCQLPLGFLKIRRKKSPHVEYYENKNMF